MSQEESYATELKVQQARERAKQANPSEATAEVEKKAKKAAVRFITEALNAVPYVGTILSWLFDSIRFILGNLLGLPVIKKLSLEFWELLLWGGKTVLVIFLILLPVILFAGVWYYMCEENIVGRFACFVFGLD